jgi:hypothetical protein
MVDGRTTHHERQTSNRAASAPSPRGLQNEGHWIILPHDERTATERNRAMTILLVGASGATGRRLLAELLRRGHRVKAVVRETGHLPENLALHPALTLVRANLLDLSDADLQELVAGCATIASCLGHTISFKGIFGPPRRLVAEATRRLCEAVWANPTKAPVKFVLMNTAGNRNRDLDERISFAHRCVMALIRRLVPPQADNEQAADFLRLRVGPRDRVLQWVAVRPDTLIDEDTVTAYDVHPSPTRCPVFNPGKTSRINVAHFMAELLDDAATWTRWQGQMPVIYNRTTKK